MEPVGVVVVEEPVGVGVIAAGVVVVAAGVVVVEEPVGIGVIAAGVVVVAAGVVVVAAGVVVVAAGVVVVAAGAVVGQVRRAQLRYSPGKKGLLDHDLEMRNLLQSLKLVS